MVSERQPLSDAQHVCRLPAPACGQVGPLGATRLADPLARLEQYLDCSALLQALRQSHAQLRQCAIPCDEDRLNGEGIEFRPALGQRRRRITDIVERRTECAQCGHDSLGIRAVSPTVHCLVGLLDTVETRQLSQPSNPRLQPACSSPDSSCITPRSGMSTQSGRLPSS
jgi:hypothetical protein